MTTVILIAVLAMALPCIAAARWTARRAGESLGVSPTMNTYRRLNGAASTLSLLSGLLGAFSFSSLLMVLAVGLASSKAGGNLDAVGVMVGIAAMVATAWLSLHIGAQSRQLRSMAISHADAVGYRVPGLHPAVS